MSDQKPLRQEDYQAQAAELAKTKRELEQLRQERATKKPKKEKLTGKKFLDGWFEIESLRVEVVGDALEAIWRFMKSYWWLIIASLLALGFVTISALGDVNNDTEVKCYVVGKTQKSDPWDSVRLWKVRKWVWRHDEIVTDQSFATAADAYAFLARYHLKVCEPGF